MWMEAWGAWPSREVWAHPGYVKLFGRERDRVLCALMEVPDGAVLFPFILRPLVVEPWTGADNRDWDVITPYGYGGPFFWGTPDVKEFWAFFDDWSKRTGVVCLFVRLSLFPEQMIPFPGHVEVNAPNVVRRLDIDSRAMWMDYKHKVRKNIKKAKRAGLEVEIDFAGIHLNDFMSIYYSTMKRRDAPERYYFPRRFFEGIIRNLYGQYVFFYVINQKKIVSAELVLVSVNYLYSFLGGTLQQAFNLCPNDLLKHEVIKWARKEGKKAYVLGGGYNGRDGIFRYKLSFAPKGEIPFKVGKQIYNVESYNQLKKKRSEWEASQNNYWNPVPDFFPVYRS